MKDTFTIAFVAPNRYIGKLLNTSSTFFYKKLFLMQLFYKKKIITTSLSIPNNTIVPFFKGFYM